MPRRASAGSPSPESVDHARQQEAPLSQRWPTSSDSPPDGDTNLYAWIAIGVPANQGYGLRGISSGRMPHFGAVLTKDQIEAIMAYERSL